MSLGFNSVNFPASCLPPSAGSLSISDVRHPCLLPPSTVTSTAVPSPNWAGHSLLVPTAVGHRSNVPGARLQGGNLAPSSINEMMNHPAALATRLHNLMTMTDPNMDSRGTEILENWRQFQQAAIAHNLDPNMLAMYHSASFDPTGSQRRKNATRETTSTLKCWLNEHRKNPYPTKGEKIMLAIITKMTLTQVSTWFANARRRLKKENKMTWTPRNRAEEDKDEDEDEEEEIVCDGTDDTMEVEEEDIDLDSSSGRESLAKDPDCGDKKLLSPIVKPVQPKIWSIVETAEKKDDVRAPRSPQHPAFLGLGGVPPSFLHPANPAMFFPQTAPFFSAPGPNSGLFQQPGLPGNFIPTSAGLMAAARSSLGHQHATAGHFQGLLLPGFCSPSLEVQDQLLKMHNSRRRSESSNHLQGTP